MVTFELFKMNAVQLAKLYKLLIDLYRTTDAKLVFDAGVANCGASDFCEAVAVA